MAGEGADGRRRSAHRDRTIRAGSSRAWRRASTAASPTSSWPSPAPAARPRSRPSCARSGRPWAFAPRASARSASSRPSGTIELEHTTPDPVKLQEIAAQARRRSCRASGDRGLEPRARPVPPRRAAHRRRRASPISRATISTITPSFEDYFDAKMRLFEELLPPGGAAVINVDTPRGEEAARRAAARGLDVWTVGADGRDDPHAERRARWLRASILSVEVQGPPPCGATCRWSAISRCRMRWSRRASCSRRAATRSSSCMRCESLKGAKGRLELVGRTSSRARRSSSTMPTSPMRWRMRMASLRPYTRGQAASWCSAAAATATGPSARSWARSPRRLADRVYVTDDNPRTEDPAAIRAAIMAAAPGRHRDRQTGPRRSAPPSTALRAGDVLLVAGKGHEEGQKIGKQVLPFSDHEAVKAAIAGTWTIMAERRCGRSRNCWPPRAARCMAR